MKNSKKINNNKKTPVRNFVIPADLRVKIKQSEKIHKYLDFARELKKKKLWNMSVTVIPIVVGVLGTVYKSLERELEELEIRRRI